MTDLAYIAIRDAIVDLKMRPGDRLDADNIGSSLGFSRAPVVEALNILRSEGLVVSKRRVGTFVREIDRDQIEEVFDAREMIEQRVTSLVIHNVSDRQIEKMADILTDSSKLLESPSISDFNYPEFMVLDALFHTEFIRLSERNLYQKWFEELAAHMQRLRHLYDGNALERSVQGQREHEKILKALRNRDVAELCHELSEHTQRSRTGALQTLDKQ